MESTQKELHQGELIWHYTIERRNGERSIGRESGLEKALTPEEDSIKREVLTDANRHSIGVWNYLRNDRGRCGCILGLATLVGILAGQKRREESRRTKETGEKRMKATRNGIAKTVLFALLLSSVLLTTMLVQQSQYLRVYFSSEIASEGRAELDLPVIAVTLKSAIHKNRIVGLNYEEVFALTADSQDLGYFEGQSYNRYLDISRFIIGLWWSDSEGASYFAIANVNTTRGQVIWKINGSIWYLGWLWQNYRISSRTQDEWLYALPHITGVLSGVLLGIAVVTCFDNIARRND